MLLHNTVCYVKVGEFVACWGLGVPKLAEFYDKPWCIRLFGDGSLANRNTSLSHIETDNSKFSSPGRRRFKNLSSSSESRAGRIQSHPVFPRLWPQNDSHLKWKWGGGRCRDSVMSHSILSSIYSYITVIIPPPRVSEAKFYPLRVSLWYSSCLPRP
jgi:hypothetical protein